MASLSSRTLSSILNRLPQTTCYVVQVQHCHSHSHGHGQQQQGVGRPSDKHASKFSTVFDRRVPSLPPTVHKGVTGQHIHTKGPKLNQHQDLLSAWEMGKWKSNFSAAALVNSAPAQIQPYLKLMRVDKPIGTWLYYWPFAWSIGLAGASGTTPDLYLLGVFGAAAVIIRGAGCCINDMLDRDFDKNVERCRTRPLAAGHVNMIQAGAFLGVQTAAAAAILSSLNGLSLGLGAVHMFFIATYPLMKRITYWPQLYLGMTFNWGALMGWAAVQGSIDWSVVIPLYASGIAWTLLYDTIYAHQDKKDDIKIGIKSTALRLADNTKLALSGFSGAMVAGLVVSGIANEQTWPYYLTVAATTAHLARQIYTVDLDNPKDCWDKFDSNKYLGLLIFLGIVAGTYFKSPKDDKTKDNH
ncbi:4-hydroxybenzoate polyprenyltransferase, mitochondrial-like [Glandiceps talaboti]